MYGFIMRGGQTTPVVCKGDRIYCLKAAGDRVVVGSEFKTLEGRTLRISNGTRLGDGYCWKNDEGFYALIKTTREHEEEKVVLREKVRLLDEQYGF